MDRLSDDQHCFQRVAHPRACASRALAGQRTCARERAEPADRVSCAGRRASRQRLADGQPHRDSARTRRHRRAAPARACACRPLGSGQAPGVDRSAASPLCAGACRCGHRARKAGHRQNTHRQGNAVGARAGTGLPHLRCGARLAERRQIHRTAAAATRRRRQPGSRGAVSAAAGDG